MFQICPVVKQKTVCLAIRAQGNWEGKLPRFKTQLWLWEIVCKHYEVIPNEQTTCQILPGFLQPVTDSQS